MDLQIIGTEKWKQEVCVSQAEVTYISAVVDVLCKEAGVTSIMGNLASESSKEMRHWQNMVSPRLL